MVKSFKAIRPKGGLEEKVASFPYDVLNSKEARELVKNNEYSFLHVVKPEVDLPESIDIHDEKVYLKAKENLNLMIEKGILQKDSKDYLYIYKQKMGNHEQFGLVSLVSADEYNNDIIKKHEYTRKDKEDDRTKHVLTLEANAGPVFLTYRDDNEIDKIIADFVKDNAPDCDFIKEDGIGHTVWVIRDENTIKSLENEFKKIDYLYVADGHHRSASAARVKAVKMKEDDNYNENKAYNYFLAVLFPSKQLKIMDYNRVLFTMNGLSKDEFFKKVEEKFEISDENVANPKGAKNFGLYIDGRWYQLHAKDGSYDEKDPVLSLDVAILQNNLLNPILGIGDPRTDNNIDFVGGIRGMKELEKRVDSKEAVMAFSLYPTAIEQLMSVADANTVMPPKSTWFEPKLRSGLFVHSFSEK